jgi:hypothetical protein
MTAKSSGDNDNSCSHAPAGVCFPQPNIATDVRRFSNHRFRAVYEFTTSVDGGFDQFRVKSLA